MTNRYNEEIPVITTKFRDWEGNEGFFIPSNASKTRFNFMMYNPILTTIRLGVTHETIQSRERYIELPSSPLTADD